MIMNNMEKRERPVKQATLCVIVDRAKNAILLGMKKRGFGVGKYNGFGGKVMPGEAYEQAMIRELREESGLDYDITALEEVGEFDFYFPHKPEFNQTVHTYLIEKIAGNPRDSEEMAFKWFPVPEIPYSEMWDDDKHWLPLVLMGQKLYASFVFKPENNENVVASKEIKEVPGF